MVVVCLGTKVFLGFFTLALLLLILHLLLTPTGLRGEQRILRRDIPTCLDLLLTLDGFLWPFCILWFWFSIDLVGLVINRYHLGYFRCHFLFLGGTEEAIVLDIGHVVVSSGGCLHACGNGLMHELEGKIGMTAACVHSEELSQQVISGDQLLESERGAVHLAAIENINSKGNIPFTPVAHFYFFMTKQGKGRGVYSGVGILSGARLLFFINNLTVFLKAQYFSMRSKQRRTYKQDRPPLTPTPHHFMPDQPQSPSSRLPRGSQSPGQGSLRGGQTRVQALQRQNNELRREIIQLKVKQFYNFDDGKLKGLIQQMQALRKEVRKQEQIVGDLQTQNDFLRRTNAQLKLQLEKEIAGRTRDAYAQESSRNGGQSRPALSRALEDELTHLASCSHFNSTTLTLDDQDYRTSPTPPPQPPRDSRSSRKQLVEKCLSPRRGKESQSANEYLLYRRGKEGREGRDRNLLQRLAE